MPDKTTIARNRLDDRLAPLRTQRNTLAVPRGGWAKAIRTALGMTLEDLAVRLGVTRSVLSRLESSEQKQTIQLDSLRRIAEAQALHALSQLASDHDGEEQGGVVGRSKPLEHAGVRARAPARP